MGNAVLVVLVVTARSTYMQHLHWSKDMMSDQKYENHGLRVLQAVDNDSSLSDIHDQAEKFDPRTEQVFKYLQIISAASMSFAHGANDVANAVGPFAAIYGIYQVCISGVES